MEFTDLPAGWEQWSQEPEKAVLAYRPDIFDSGSFPAACLPTIYVTKGKRGRRPGRPAPDPSDPWYVTLYLEPEVSTESSFDSREAAKAGATDQATRFAAGKLDYRSLYQAPRESYLAKLDELTGRIDQ